ncbi:hypothetical protein HW555_008116, partial [Spodoptera exigua]
TPRKKSQEIDTITKRTILRLKNSIEKLRAKYKKQKTLVQCAKQISTKKSFLKLIEKLPESSRVFTLLQIKGHLILPEVCQQTADFLPIFDQLFDSFNGHFYQMSTKKYKTCLKNSSPHIQLWNNLLPVLESIKFQSIKNHNHVITMCIVYRQEILIKIRKKIFSVVLEAMELEITIHHTLIINNFNSTHSPHSNCEKDNNVSSNDDFACEVDSLITVMGNIKRNNNNEVHAEAKKDFCHFVDEQSFNYEVDYTKKSLFYPNKNFNALMNEIYYLIVACLRISPESHHVKDKIKLLLNCACDYSIITCDLHKVHLIELINALSPQLVYCK